MKKAIIYDAAGADPRRDRIERPDLTVLAVADPGQLAAVAAGLARDGTTLIELCGAISPRWRPIVQAAAGLHARVSSVTFGIESLAVAARFSQASMDGTPPPGAFIFIEAGADPRQDRFVTAFPPQHTTFVAVPDDTAAAAVARELTDGGVALIELYGGFTAKGAAAVIDAVDGRAAVGVGSFTLEATYPGAATVT